MLEHLLTKVYSRKTKLLVYVAMYALLMGLIWLGLTVSEKLQTEVFYLVPIFILAVIVGRNASIVMAVLETLTYSGTKILAGQALDGVWIWNTVVSLFVFMLFAFLISAMKRALERESMYARTDTLTGLPNRKAFNELAQKEFFRCKRNQVPITLAYIDCDDFKLVNDRYGHAAGDQLLQNIGVTIQQQLRVTDIVARIGGDELVVLLPETGSTTALIVIERLQQSLMQAVMRAGLPITFSIGVAVFKDLPDTIDDMLQRADGLMYDVKYSGKNQINLAIF